VEQVDGHGRMLPETGDGVSLYGARLMEVWTTGLSLPRVAARMATRAEDAGFDGMVVVDSQNLAGDCYVALAMAARETERLQLATGVTNPFTRHPAVTASAIASIHAESGGRAVLGIGRGDSALAHLGRAPARVAHLRRYLEAVQSYLRGDEIAFDDLSPFAPEGAAPAVDTLGLDATAPTSQLHWLRPDLPKVPVDVSATGPKVIDAAAEIADRVTLAVGADLQRLAWAIDRVRASARDVSIGAFVNVISHPDLEVARKLATGGMSTFARFNVMHGATAGPLFEGGTDTLSRLHDAYDMRQHTRADSPQAATLDAEFVDHFGIVGPPDVCVDRLQALAALGLERIVIVGPSFGSDREAAAEAMVLFTKDVLPELHTDD
jgi:5,10-methylenetetrahydromethanopterin reductase